MRALNHAPSSTKNREQKRDPEMHQTRKGKQWYFSMKAHVGVDSKSKLIHAVVATPANVADSRVLPDLLHGDETRVWGDQAYRGQGRVLEEYAPLAKISPVSSTVIRIGSMKWSVPRTARRRKCAPRWSMCLR